MRLGCGGCLSSLLIVAILGGTVVGAGWAVMRALEPPTVSILATTAEDGARAQRKVYELYRGARGQGAGVVVITERELNALLLRQLAGELPVTQPVARLLGDDRAEVGGLIRVDELLYELTTAREWLPSVARQHRVWVRLVVRPEYVNARRREIRLVPERAAIGRLRVPAFLVRWLVEPGVLRYLRWAPPARVRGVLIEPGRLVIQTSD